MHSAVFTRDPAGKRPNRLHRTLAARCPTVGLASIAASAIARSAPIRTGITAFGYSLRTAILPFLFIFSTKLLLIGLAVLNDLALTVASATVAMLIFAAATQAYFFARNLWCETLVLLLICFTLFRPNFWLDWVVQPYSQVRGQEMLSALESAAPDASKRLWVEGINIEGDEIQRGVLLPLGPTDQAAKR